MNEAIKVLPGGYVSRADAASRLGLTAVTLAAWAAKGKGPKTYKRGNRIFYLLDEVDEFAKGEMRPHNLSESASKQARKRSIPKDLDDLIDLISAVALDHALRKAEGDSGAYHLGLQRAYRDMLGFLIEYDTPPEDIGFGEDDFEEACADAQTFDRELRTAILDLHRQEIEPAIQALVAKIEGRSASNVY